MDLFKLLGTIAIDNSEANKALDETGNKGTQAESKLSKGFKAVGKGAAAVGKAMATGLAVAGTAVAGLATKSIQSFADYEQLVGGVDTLFKSSSAKVQEYAANAYKTAGMSANAYMETVTGFSASLLQSLDGDTAAAAEKADMAITDMSDNANKMGTDISMIQNAYQGFAKQNYTMLDNLKLGYGGTQEEMKRLLADAEAISGIEYDISSYADVVDAIHIIQTEMGVTGTTAREASSTISGSISSMKGSWENLLTAISSDDLPFDDYVDNFVDSVVTVADNLLPRIEIALNGVVSLVDKLGPVLIEKIPGLLSSLLPSLLTAAVSLINSIVAILPGLIDMLVNTALPQAITGIVEIFNALVEALPVAVEALVSALPTLLPQLINGLVSMIVTLCTMLPQIIQPIIDYLPDIIISVAEAIVQNLPVLIQGVISLVLGLVSALPQIITGLVGAAPTVITMVIDALIAALPQLIQGVIQLIMGIVAALPQIIQAIVDALPLIITGIVNGLIALLPQLIAGVVQLISALVVALPQILQSLWDAVIGILGGLREAIKNVFAPITDWFSNMWDGLGNVPGLSSLKTMIEEVWGAIQTHISTVVNAIKSVVSSVFNGIKGYISGVFNGIKSTAQSAWNGIMNAIKTPIEKAKGIVKGVIDAIKGFFSFKISWPKIPMPHFGISPSGWQIGDLLKGSIPKLAIDWYAKAMDNPIVMTKPTIWGYDPTTGNLKGGGEAGPEVVSGANTLMNMIQAAVSAKNNQLVAYLEALMDMLAQYFPEALDAMRTPAVFDADRAAVALAGPMNRELGRLTAQKGRGR